MKLSVDWLSDFVDLSGIDDVRLAEQVTVRTAEVEGIERVRRSLEGVIVARVAEVSPVAGAEGRLSAVVVDTGSGTSRTVCGAPNVRVGMKALFAPAGTVLAGNKRIERTEMHGHESAGVLCSAAEIGLGTSHVRLLECPADTPVGAPLSRFVPAEDVLIEIDNKSLTHRPDLWGHYGFARELAAIFDRSLKPLVVADLERFANLPAYPVVVENHDDCPYYSALELAVRENPVSSLLVQRRLYTLGLTPIDCVVDATNYVQLEIGQPTHAFDAARVSGIRVARSGEARRFAALDGKSWQLVPDDLLIWSGSTPVALAGIKGGEGTEMVAGVKKIVLESANFRASRVRVTSVRLSLRTDASLRFEKKLPPVTTKIATGRILHLLEQAGIDPTPTSRYSGVGDLQDSERVIEIPPGYLTRRAGAEISDALATRLLTSIGFRVEAAAHGGLSVGVPPFRSKHDISIPEDISEEVMRLHGYDQIPPVAPVPSAALDATVLPNPLARGQQRQRRLLSQAHDYVEVQTYGWFEDEWIKALGYEPAQPLTLRNPIANGRGRMRDTLVPNLLAVANQNRRVRERFRIYEHGKIFWSTSTGKSAESNELAGVSVEQGGRLSAEQHVRTVRGALDDLMSGSGLAPFEYVLTNQLPRPWMGERTTLTLRAEGRDVGHLGLLPAKLRPSVSDSGHVVWFALSADALVGEVYPATRYRPPPAHPGSWQDFTFVWPVAQGYDALERRLAQFSHAWLERRELLDVYRPKNAEAANITLRFWLRHPDRTLDAAEIQDFREQMVAFQHASELKTV